jgi:hypothetical protein
MRSDLLTLNLRRAIKYAARGFGLALPQRRVNEDLTYSTHLSWRRH